MDMLSAVEDAVRQAAAAHPESEAGKVQPLQQGQELALQKAQVSSYLDHPMAIWLISAVHSGLLLFLCNPQTLYVILRRCCIIF